MTRDELDSTFLAQRPRLLEYARRKFKEIADQEDLANQTYMVAAGRSEYLNVPVSRAKSWWYYQLRDEMTDLEQRRSRENQTYTNYSNDPTETLINELGLTELEAREAMEEYWNTLTPSKQSRLRTKWIRDGIPILACMIKKPTWVRKPPKEGLLPS